MNTIVFLSLSGPLLLAAVAVLSRFEQGARPRYVLGASRFATLASFLLAIGSAVYVAVAGARSTEVFGVDPIAFSIRLDALSVTLYLLVAFVGAVAVQFSRNYLDGEKRQCEFLGHMCLTLCAVSLLVLSGSLFQMVLAWIGTSVALHRLLLFHSDRPRAVAAARKKFICARVADGFLIVAAVLLYLAFGTGDISQILHTSRPMSGAGAMPLSAQGAALLIVLAAAFKSAQFPFHGWLTEVMETPTPVSALLHAGIVNAGGFLVVRLSDVVVSSPIALHLLVLIGGLTALVGTVVMLTQTNIKSSLAWSTVSQMGFMLLQCGFGAFSAATLHIVAHSLYKAHAFLASGSAVDTGRIQGASPQLVRPSLAILVGVALGALGLFIGIGMIGGVSLTEKPAVVALGAILLMGLSQFLVRGVSSGHGGGMLVRVFLMTSGLAVLYFGLQQGAAWIAGDLFPPAVVPDALGIAAMVLLVVLFGVISLAQLYGWAWAMRWPGIYVYVSNGFYANAMFDRTIGCLETTARQQH
ncbi:MAG: oxidoreductase [Candidatus Hydrogenedentes bacterium]|nr:oxidoreductase [Candidatus Hydrogenedentota bacterium]